MTSLIPEIRRAYKAYEYQQNNPLTEDQYRCRQLIYALSQSSAVISEEYKTELFRRAGWLSLLNYPRQVTGQDR